MNYYAKIFLNKQFDVWFKTDCCFRYNTVLSTHENKLFFPNIHNLKSGKRQRDRRVCITAVDK